MEDDTFLPRLVFSEATLHLSGIISRHNVPIWGLQNPQEALEYERDSPKINVFCALLQTKVYGPFFFCWKQGYWGNVSRDAAKLASSSNEWIFRRLHFPTGRNSTPLAPGCSTLSESLPQRWIGRVGKENLALQFWPPRSPDLTPCDFFLWGFVKEAVYVPSLPTTSDYQKKYVSQLRRTQ